jgi:PTH1 family peptidyl-tRNA hydrolase
VAVGLGNPGAEYAGSRHNYGAEAVRIVGRRHQQSLRAEKGTSAETATVRTGGKSLLLAVPQTYVNDSGLAVRALWRRYLGPESSPEQLVVVHDELDLPPGIVRVKMGGGTGGHNGLRSIQSHLRTNEFARVRIGVGKPPSAAAGADHVLRRPSKRDRELLDVATEIAADAVETILVEGVAAAMNRFNTKS